MCLSVGLIITHGFWYCKIWSVAPIKWFLPSRTHYYRICCLSHIATEFKLSGHQDHRIVVTDIWVLALENFRCLGSLLYNSFGSQDLSYISFIGTKFHLSSYVEFQVLGIHYYRNSIIWIWMFKLSVFQCYLLWDISVYHYIGCNLCLDIIEFHASRLQCYRISVIHVLLSQNFRNSCLKQLKLQAQILYILRINLLSSFLWHDWTDDVIKTTLYTMPIYYLTPTDQL